MEPCNTEDPRGTPVRRVLYTVEEVSRRIEAGERLILAGDGRLLDRLPRGHWIAGTIPYFMGEYGGVFSKNLIMVNELPPVATDSKIKVYDAATVGDVYADAPENGVSVIILPAAGPTHFRFALEITQSEGFASKPLIGWVSGTEMPDTAGKPLVYDGEGSGPLEDGAVVMHIGLPEDKRAEINIVNVFSQDGGDTLMFLEDGFSASEVLVNGTAINFADYIDRRGVDVRFPLVADYFGAMINISFKSVDLESGEVYFYAPVFRGVEYKLAAPVKDYGSLFASDAPAASAENSFFSCNCILNYFNSQLEGRRSGDLTGPVSFGEIAYQLLNQTLVYAVVKDRTC